MKCVKTKPANSVRSYTYVQYGSSVSKLIVVSVEPDERSYRNRTTSLVHVAISF